MPHSSETSRKLVQQIIDEQDKLEKLGIAAAILIARQVRIRMLRAFPRQSAVLQEFAEGMARIKAVATEGAAVAHVVGEVGAKERAAAVIAGRIAATEVLPQILRRTRIPDNAYSGAVQFMRDKAKLTSADFQDLRTTYFKRVSVATDAAKLSMERQLQATMTQAVVDGVHVREGVSRLRGSLDSTLGNAAKDIPSRHLETLFRTQVATAYSAGRQRANMDPDIDSILWGYEYVAIDDDRVRPTHLALDGTTLAKNDPRWGSIMPPNGFNCRCTVIEIFDEGQEIVPPETAEVEVREGEFVTVVPGPDKGFNFNPVNTIGPVPSGDL